MRRRSAAITGMAILTATTGLLAGHTGVSAAATCTIWTVPADEQDTQTEPAIPGVIGGFSPALDLVQGTMTADFGSGSLHVRVYVQDMSLAVPDGGSSMTYATGWAINTAQEQVAYVRVDSSGTVSYYDLHSSQPDTGSYVLGPNGYVEVDVPFAHLGIQRGSVLPGVSTEASVQDAFVSQTGTGTSQSEDSSPTPGGDYTIGSAC